MIDLDAFVNAARKPWYCRSEEEENMLSPEFIADASARIRQDKKDAERYRWLRDCALRNHLHSLIMVHPEEWDVFNDEDMKCSGDNK